MSKTLVRARVLCAAPAYGLLVNQILSGPATLIQALSADGTVDPHPDAVAYAESAGAVVVEIADAPEFADTQPIEQTEAAESEAQPESTDSTEATAPKPRARRSSTAE